MVNCMTCNISILQGLAVHGRVRRHWKAPAEQNIRTDEKQQVEPETPRMEKYHLLLAIWDRIFNQPSNPAEQLKGVSSKSRLSNWLGHFARVM